MSLKYKLLISFSFAVFFTSYGQMKKANNAYLKFQFAKAVPIFNKVIKKNDADKQEALVKLAECYKILGDYQKAELAFADAEKINKLSADASYSYGDVLKINNKYPEALQQYKLYLASKPTDSKVQNAIKSCQEIKYWQPKPKEYEVKNIEEINTARSEFSPVIYKNKLIYVGEKVTDIVDFEKSFLNNQPYLDIFESKLKKNGVSKSKQFSKKTNSVYHDGPIAFSETSNLICFTRVNGITNRKNKEFVNRAKLYFASQNGTRLSKPKAFQYNSDDYSCAHAAFSKDGNTMYFASDMPGGFGGQDIWMCKKNGDAWDKPINLGADINTSGDEVFPNVKSNELIYFSSNGLPGFGGLDIFSAKSVNGKWLLNRNEGLFLNSNKDDFGIVFLNDSLGYFSSNRDGGKGQDDIYSFKFSNKYITVDGTVLLTENTNDPARGLKIYLLDEKGKKIDSTYTNEKGYFAFKNLDADKKYMAEIEETEANFKSKSRYYLADKNDKIARITHKDNNGNKFVFKNLPVDVNGLPDLYNDDDLNLAGNLLYGENPSQPLANKKVVIKNEFGDVIEETTTNEFGAFAFRNLPIDQNYSLYIDDEELPADAKIILTNKAGKQVKTVKSDGKGKFKFSLLSVDKTTINDLSVEDKDLVMALKGYLYDQDKKAITNAKVTVFNKNEVITNIITDEKGRFEFKNLSADKNYIFAFDDDDVRFTNVSKIYIADSKGRIYKEITRSTNGKFRFELLEVDKIALGEYSVEDPWLEVLQLKNKQKQETITIVENVTYAYGDYKIDEAAKNLLNKVITVLNSNPNLNIELSSHTDSRSSDAYNLQLSQKRAKAAVDYLISKGINKNRLKAIGYGESKLLNRCKNNVDCTEEEHAVNRRTEFKIVEIGKL